MKVKHLTFQGRIPYFQRAVPKDLQKALGRKKIVQRLECDIHDQNAIEIELLKIRQNVQSLFDTYRNNSKQSTNDDISQQLKEAEQLLKLMGISKGELDPTQYNVEYTTDSERAGLDAYIDHQTQKHFSNLADRQREQQYLRETMGELDSAPVSRAEKIELLAYKMARDSSFGQLEQHTIKAAVAHHINTTELKIPKAEHNREKQRKRELARLTEVLSYFNADVPITTSNIGAALRAVIDQKQDKVTNKTLTRDLAGFKTALNVYIDKYNIEAQVPNKKLSRKTEQKLRPVPTKSDYNKIFEAASDLAYPMAQELRLMLLLMLQTSAHIQELLDSEIPSDTTLKDCLIIKKGKTAYRTRPVVYTLQRELINTLIKDISKGSSDQSSKIFKADNVWANAGSTTISRRIITAIRRITGSEMLVSYSFRHGWKNNAILAMAPSDIQNRLGGWIDSANQSAVYGRGGDLSAERIELYRNWQARIAANWLESDLQP